MNAQASTWFYSSIRYSFPYIKLSDHELLTTLYICSVTCQLPSNKQSCRCALQADFTFFCPSEIVAFSDRLGDFLEINTEVRLVSLCMPWLPAGPPQHTKLATLTATIFLWWQVIGASVDSVFSHLAWTQQVRSGVIVLCFSHLISTTI